MENAMLEARHEGGAYRRIEVITGKTRRRRWSATEKARIVAESFASEANVSEVARRHGINCGLLNAWRREASSLLAKATPTTFTPVVVDEASGNDKGPASQNENARPAAAPARKTGIIEIEMAGAVIRAPAGADAESLVAIVAALRRAS